VHAGNSSNFDTITLGNGAGDVVNPDSSNTSTITLGNGAGDVVNAVGNTNTITLGDGAGDVVNAINGSNNTITLGDGNNDTVYSGGISTIKIGNGNDTIHVGTADTVTVGTGQDSFVFDQTVAGTIGAVTINHFDPSKDVIVLTQTLVPGQNVLPAHDDANGNAVVTVVPGDTITLVGVHSSALHASDFQFV
jgi:Ca2+-binding RTX toxin-like protein